MNISKNESIDSKYLLELQGVCVPFDNYEETRTGGFVLFKDNKFVASINFEDTGVFLDALNAFMDED